MFVGLGGGGGTLSRHWMRVKQLGRRVGEKFEFLLNFVIAGGVVTKRHIDNHRDREFHVASPQ